MAQIKLKKLSKLPNKIYETSGLIIYQNKYLITHNDGGNKSEIFVLSKSGELLKTIDVEDTKNYDWEDIAQDEKGNVYIGDFGNNLNKRKNLHVYILEEGFISKKHVDPKKISFNYEDQDDFPPKKKNLNFDCEAMFYKDNALYLMTKCRSEPFTGLSKIYKLPAKKGKYKAKLIGQFYLCHSSWKTCSVTAADYNPKTNTLSILTYSKLYVVTNIKGDAFWNGKVKVYNVPFIKQREAIANINQDKWYITDEYKKGLGGGNLYLMYLKK
ncbi:MAG: hypothetical protein ACWA41_11060 [Putridiphycobacter sp.]